MFSHPHPPTTQPFEVGYVCYMRLLTISNMVMASLWQDQGVRTGMHVEYDDRGNTVIRLYLLGLTPKDQRASSLLSMVLVSNLSDDLIFVQRVRDGAQTEAQFRFVGQQHEDPEETDMRIAAEVAELAGATIRTLYDDPTLEAPVEQSMQTARDGSFMKKVVSKKEIGTSTNYEVKFDDGTAIRCTLPTTQGEQIKAGDWIYNNPAEGLQRIAAQRVN